MRRSERATRRSVAAPSRHPQPRFADSRIDENHEGGCEERRANKNKKPARGRERASNQSLAVAYFRRGKPHTIIGAERFHFRVRNGIGWFPLAMAARQTVAADASRTGSVIGRAKQGRGQVARPTSQHPRLGCYMVK